MRDIKPIEAILFAVLVLVIYNATVPDREISKRNFMLKCVNTHYDVRGTPDLFGNDKAYTLNKTKSVERCKKEYEGSTK